MDNEKTDSGASVDSSPWLVNHWTRSTIDEIIGCLWLIAGLVALGIEHVPRWCVGLLFIKGGSDMLCSVAAAFAERRRGNTNDKDH